MTLTLPEAQALAWHAFQTEDATASIIAAYPQKMSAMGLLPQPTSFFEIFLLEDVGHLAPRAMPKSVWPRLLTSTGGVLLPHAMCRVDLDGETTVELMLNEDFAR